MADTSATTGRRRVAVCICTFRRPHELDRLLTRLAAVAADAAETCAVGVVVIDDDGDRSAAPIVARHLERFELGVATGLAGRQNISVARNLALAEGARMAEWLAFIDDDCVPDPDWIRQLVVVQEATGGDGVSGRCVDEPPPDGPAWYAEEPFLDEVAEHADGAPMEIGRMKNLLLSRRFVVDHDISFDEAFGVIGGEDVMFFRALGAAAVDLRYAALAVVREQVPRARARLGYQLWRSLWYGNTGAVTTISVAGGGRLRAIARGGRKVVTSSLRPVNRMIGRQRPQLRYAACGVLEGVGTVLGGVGVRLHHR